ncbi:MAG TPA: pyridoxamine 5'-phosphate oxidase family protein [Vicinamibacterales bacterium]|nr:pyridoxamine 5'-phosphate oxidase family protein [Vicinamibacterales bacterium]
MSRLIGHHLSEALLDTLSAHRAIERADCCAIVICSVDEQGRPHPAMLSSLEIVARDARDIRLAVHASSRTARNLTANRHLTIILADETGVHYVKGDAALASASMTTAPALAAFTLHVDRVLEDTPADYEQSTIVSGIRITRGTLDRTRAEAILRELSES